MADNFQERLKVAVIGAGVRGTNLARQLVRSNFSVEIVAVAEPNQEKRRRFLNEFSLDDCHGFNDWEELVKSQSRCEAVIITTLDNQHTKPTIACLKNGWHVLLEKPLADKFEDCLLIEKTQKESRTVLAVCHTLRFMNAFRKIKQLLIEGQIGKLVHIEHMEGIGHMRFAHNYVRGRWAREENNTFLLLHKCCHDIDYICWLVGESCEQVSSFGSLKHFTAQNALNPNHSHCIDCDVEDSCPYSAIRIYVNEALDEWPARDVCETHTKEAHLNAIKNGPYGLCVWQADNNVVDHQVVMMEFNGGTTATCTMSGYSATNGRRLRLQGTEGELLFDEAEETIIVNRFFEQREKRLKIPAPTSYHPEDLDIVDDWLASIISNSSSVAVDAQEALRTHAVVFAAEMSRKEKKTIRMPEYLKMFDSIDFTNS